MKIICYGFTPGCGSVDIDCPCHEISDPPAALTDAIAQLADVTAAGSDDQVNVTGQLAKQIYEWAANGDRCLGTGWSDSLVFKIVDKDAWWVGWSWPDSTTLWSE